MKKRASAYRYVIALALPVFIICVCYHLNGAAACRSRSTFVSSFATNPSRHTRSISNSHGTPTDKQFNMPVLPATDNDTDYDVIIVGAGITGLATAVALIQREKIAAERICIIEKSQVLQPIGATLGLFPNGLTALQSISEGVAQKVVDLGIPYVGVQQRNLMGDVVMEKNLTMTAGANNTHVLAWYLLQEALVEALPSESANDKNVLNLGTCLESFVEHKNDGIITVTARQFEFQNATGGDTFWTATCKILIGADGIHSRVRDLLFPPPSSRSIYTYHKRFMYRAILREDEFDSSIILPPHGYTVSFRCGKPGKVFAFRQNAKGIYSFTSTVFVEEDARGLVHSHSHNSDSTKKSRMLEHFKEYCPAVQHLMTKVKNEAIYENAVFDIDVLNQWSRGSVVLIGDAAHAMTPALGQGANIGLEDSTEIAHCLGILLCADKNGVEGDTKLTSMVISKILKDFWLGRLNRTRRVHALSRILADERNKGNADYKVDRSFITSWKPSFLPP